jgi:hypothetical protein
MEAMNGTQYLHYFSTWFDWSLARFGDGDGCIARAGPDPDQAAQKLPVATLATMSRKTFSLALSILAMVGPADEKPSVPWCCGSALSWRW